MMRTADGHKKAPFKQKHSLSLAVVVINVVLFMLALLSYGRYATGYQERLREENLVNIANLNQSSALNATAFIRSWGTKLEDIIQCVDERSLDYDETLELIAQSNSSEDRLFELIGSDYTGYLAQRDESGGHIPVSYDNSSYAELHGHFNDVGDDAYEDICFMPEFSDSYTALKHFAIYRHLTLENSAGEVGTYTLMLTTRSSDVLEVLNSQAGFDAQSTVLISASGDYIVSNADFKSDNFYQYMYVYNDLTLDQRNAMAAEVAQNGSGELYYKNGSGQDCVFRYERMTTNDWYAVTCVPIASFRTPVFNVNYAVYAVIALIIMMVVDVIWLQYINRRLRVSAQREKEASDAKTDFLSRMSHDIRTPLNGIIGLTGLAMEEEASPRVREYLNNINVSGQFLSGLVNDILDLSKVESGKIELSPEPYSGGDLFRYIEAVVAPLCKEKGLSFRTNLPDDSAPVLLDRLRFNQIMFNILSNAVKYTPTGGFVELNWHRSDLPDGKVALDIAVRDNGIGMSEEFQRHMFESFSQEHAQTATQGSGLGLAIVHSLVDLMGGSIRVNSEQGVGTTFAVHLEAAACEAQQEAAPEVSDIKLAGRRALLCEDNQINIMVAKRMLEKLGITVDSAVNGRQGIEMFAASATGEYDVILMDVMMPEMNGLDATRAIRKLPRADAATIPILAMTANAYDTDVKNCLDAGMNAHMSKPIDMQQLKSMLSAMIDPAGHCAASHKEAD